MTLPTVAQSVSVFGFGCGAQYGGNEFVAAFADLDFDAVGGHKVAQLAKSEFKGAGVLRVGVDECSVQVKQ